MIRQPVAPIDLQIALDDQMRSGHGHVGDKDDRQHADLGDKAAHGVLLQGVEQRRAPLGNHYRQDHLHDGQERQEEGGAPNLQLLF